MPSQKRSAMYTLSFNSPSGIKPLTNSLDLMDQQCSSLVVVILNLIFLKNYFTLCNIRLLKMFELCLTSDSQSVQSDGFSIRLYCIVLYLYIYIALLAVHTNQKMPINVVNTRLFTDLCYRIDRQICLFSKPSYASVNTSHKVWPNTTSLSASILKKLHSLSAIKSIHVVQNSNTYAQ